jgi:serine protease Do
MQQGGGNAVIDFDGGCDNIFGCIPSMLEERASFANYVMGPLASTDQGAALSAASPASPSGPSGKPTLGVQMIPTPSPIESMLHIKGGLMIVSVTPGSPAERGGIKPGDVVLRYGKKTLNTVSDLQSAVATATMGSSVSLDVWRGSGEVIVPVKF